MHLCICLLKNPAGYAEALLKTPLPVVLPYKVDHCGVSSPSLGSLAGLVVQGVKWHNA